MGDKTGFPRDSHILVAMAVINEWLLLRGSRQPQCSNILVQKGQGELVMNVGYSYWIRLSNEAW